MERHLIKSFQSQLQPTVSVEVVKSDDKKEANKKRLFQRFSKAQLISTSLRFLLLILVVTGTLVGAKSFIDYHQPWPNFLETQQPQYGATPYIARSAVEFTTIRPANKNPEKYAKSLIDSLTGDVIYAYDPDSLVVYADKNGDEKVHIASITKLMSVMVIRQKYSLEDEITFTGKYHDWENGLGVLSGEKMSVGDALKVMLIASKNDVAEEFAETYPDGGYDGFIAKMNELARSYGMKDSSFDSASGLWEGEGNLVTAHDLRILIARVLGDGVLMDIVGKTSDSVSLTKVSGKVVEIQLLTTNYLLNSVDGALGLKTGYTKLAGQCLIGYFVWSVEGGDVSYGGRSQRRLVTIVLGSADRFGDTKRLVE